MDFYYSKISLVLSFVLCLIKIGYEVFWFTEINGALANLNTASDFSPSLVVGRLKVTILTMAIPLLVNLLFAVLGF